MSAVVHFAMLLVWLAFARPTADSVNSPEGDTLWVELENKNNRSSSASNRKLNPVAPAPNGSSLKTSISDSESSSEPESSQGQLSSGQFGVAGGKTISERERYLAELRAYLDHRKRYPSAARLRGIEGSPTVRFRVHLDGTINAESIAVSSGSTTLDTAALELIRSLKKFKPLPSGSADHLVVTLPIAYSLSSPTAGI